jgi:hypothetical protein
VLLLLFYLLLLFGSVLAEGLNLYGDERFGNVWNDRPVLVGNTVGHRRE